MGDFFPLDSHLMVYFIIWEMHGFPHQFRIEWENVTKPIASKLLLIIFPQYGCFFPLDSHPMVYFILWEMHMISYQFHITLEKTVKPIKWGKTGKLVASNILQNSSYSENLGNWYPYFSHSMDVFSIRFPSSGILHHVGNASVFSTNFPEH